MFCVHVFVHVKREHIDAFRQASVENARNSVEEAGCVRFDVLQEEDDPTRFLLVEIYRASEDAAQHKETAHYAVWRDTVDEMMATPRTSIKYMNLFPTDENWK